MTSEQVQVVVDENARLRGKLLELAKECAECNGTGCTTVRMSEAEQVVPCVACLDIREILS